MHTGLKHREVCKTRRAPDAEHRTVRCSPNLNPGSNAKRTSHRARTTGRISLRPVPVVRCLTLARPSTDYIGRTDSASDFSKFSHRCNGKYALHFLKKCRIPSNYPLSTLQTPPFKLHLLLKECQHHKVCINKCAHVLAFSQSFSSKELSLGKTWCR